MARSDLLNLLPDFDQGRPAPRPGPPGFEPLVHAAFSKEEFSSLDMPAGFTGLGQEPEPELDPFADIGGGEIGGSDDDLADLNLADPNFSEETSFPSLNDEMPELPDEIDPPDLMSEVPDLDSPAEADLAALNNLDDVDIGAADAIAAQEALEVAHREEIERLQQAHREALDTLLTESIPKAKQEIIEAIAADLAPLVATRVRAGLLESTLEALARKIAEILDDASALAFDLRGPEYLISAFMEKWTGDTAQIKTIADDGVDLVARVDRTVIATRLSEFDRLIGEATA